MSETIVFIALLSIISGVVMLVRKAFRGRVHSESEAWATLYAFGSISAEEYSQVASALALRNTNTNCLRSLVSV